MAWPEPSTGHYAIPGHGWSRPDKYHRRAHKGCSKIVGAKSPTVPPRPILSKLPNDIAYPTDASQGYEEPLCIRTLEYKMQQPGQDNCREFPTIASPIIWRTIQTILPAQITWYKSEIFSERPRRDPAGKPR